MRGIYLKEIIRASSLKVTLKPNPKQSLLLECDALHFPDEIGKPDFFFFGRSQNVCHAEISR